MNCAINRTLVNYLDKGKKVEVIRRYLRMRYGIRIDTLALKNRMESLKMDYKFY